LFESAANRSEVICTFLALLELIRLRQLVCSQPEPFGEIEIRRAAPAADGAPVSDSAQTDAPPVPSAPAATPATEPVPAATAETSPQSAIRNPQSS
jgi:hypothetical protein